MKKIAFVKNANLRYKNTETGFIQTKYDWLDGIAFHNYNKDFYDCNHDEKVWIVGEFIRNRRKGVFVEVCKK